MDKKNPSYKRTEADSILSPNKKQCVQALNVQYFTDVNILKSQNDTDGSSPKTSGELPVCTYNDIWRKSGQVIELSTNETLSQTLSSQSKMAHTVENNNEETIMNHEPLTTINEFSDTTRAMVIEDDAQSACISTATIAVTAYNGLANFSTTRDADTILKWSNNIYTSVSEGAAPRFITPDEIPPLSLTFEGININVSKPVSMHSTFSSSHDIEANLSQIIHELPHDSKNKVGYMLTNNNKTVPFWKTVDDRNDIYYVSREGRTNGVFKSVSVQSLRSFLIARTACDHGNGEYSIHRVEVTCVPLPSSYNCVSLGTKNQNDFSGSNTQCVIMSTVANAVSAANGGTEFTTQEIDTILDFGNEIYNNMFPDGNTRMIEPDEIPTRFDVADLKFNVTTPEWVYSQLYPAVANNSEAILKLTKALQTNAFNDSYTNATGLFLTGQGYTISFWRDRKTTCNDSKPYYYLFNSHAVNKNNVHDYDESKNKARLFKTHNLASLAALLIKNRRSTREEEFTVHKMTVEFERTISNVQQVDSASNVETSTTAEGDWTPIVTKKPGRPKKGKKGRSAISNFKQIVSNTTATESEETPETKKQNNPKKLKQSPKLKENTGLNIQTNSFIKLEIEETVINTVVSDSESTKTNTSTTIERKETVVTKKSRNSIKKKRGRPTLNENTLIKVTETAIKPITNQTTMSNSESIRTTSTITESKETLGTNKRGRPNKRKRGPPKQKEIIRLKTIEQITLITDQVASDSESVVTTSTIAEEEKSLVNKKHGRSNKKKGPTKNKNSRLKAFEMEIEQATVIVDEIVSHSESINRTPTMSNKTETLGTNKRGRPNKNKRGPPKQKEITRLETIEMEIERDTLIADQNASDSDSIITTKSIAEGNRTPVSIECGRPKKLKRGAPKQKENAHLEASTQYNISHPEIHNEAGERYRNTHYDQILEASQRHRENNPQQTNNAYQRYNTEDRNIPPPLRRRGLICEKSGEDLDTIELYSLKKTTLQTSVTCSQTNCRAPFFEEELTRKQWCCGEGRYSIINLPPIEERFYSDPQFVRNSRAYNNLFAFSALGTSGGFQNPPHGISFIKVLGRIYHRVFDLSYTDTQNNIGLYIDDGAERQRLANERGLNRDITIEINHYLHNVNPFIDCFKRLSQEPSEQARLVFEQTTRRRDGNILGDMPRSTEIAAILSTSNESYTPKSIAIWKIGNARPHTVDIFHPLYESLQFPLLYPHGGAGWAINTRDNNNNKLSQVKYYRKLLLSEPRFSQLGRLSDEWLVDMYCRVEEERLRFISNRQNIDSNNQLRSAPLEEVQLNLELAQDETIQAEGGIIPGRVYLPNTFTHSPRYMKCKYMDSLAIVNRLGKPSYFLTITCNPKWVEIQNSTTSCQQSPSIIARVFKLKLMELLKDIRNPRWFGNVVYILYVIEFQKRGLPHAHICFRVEGGGPVQNTDIDKVIRADIPLEHEAGGRLREYVLRHMIHGPCGREHRTDLPCWDQSLGKCTKYFPKDAIDTTYVDEKGFVHLKRNAENTGTITFRNQSVTVNDTWVVPYNAALLLKYNCHINLEIASTRKIIKYLFKYLAKGPDEASVAIVPDSLRNDEVEQYVTRRYVGACDAAWRMLEFNVTSREPNVKMLAVHVENRQTIFFRPGDEAEAAQRASSDLIKYFNRPMGPEFDTLTYQDFYENYLIHTRRPQNTNTQRAVYEICDGKYFVTKRQRGEMVTRLFWVQPSRGEQFYLRLLLNAYPCRSFDDLRALGGTECQTFQRAAQVIGMADDQLEYETCLQEASMFYTARRLRYFFVLLITNEAPGAILWERFKNALSEDYLERFSGSQAEDLAYKRALLDIDRLLRKHGSCLADHGLPVVEDDTTELGRERNEYNIPETNTRLRDYTELWLPQLSPEQRNVFGHVNNLLVNDNNNVSSTATTERTCPTAIFLDGPSGTGKTLLLNVIVAHVRGVLNRVAICTASSGIAAQNYTGGTTAHSMFRLPLEVIDDNGYWNLTNGSQRAELIRAASLIIYDEAPMAHKYLINLLDRSLRDLMGSNRLFGGKLIIFAGDYRQIPPVVPRARNHTAIIQASLRTSHIWPKLTKFTLSQAQRTRGDQDYSDFLLRLGSGQCEVHDLDPNHRTMISLQNSVSVVTELDELIDFVFPSDTLNDPDICANRAILCTHNINVREINGRILERVQGEYIPCLSADNVDPELANEFFLGPETLHRVQASGVPDHELRIKIGCICMIMRNLSFVDSLVNGTKVIVVDVSSRLITVRKPGKSDVFLIPRITFKTPIEPRSPIEMIRRQFPLQVCYSFSIHKSQGQTIERVGVDLRSDVFSHGQLYVALGRVRNQQNICVLLPRERIIDDIPFVNNVIIEDLIN